MKFLFGTDVLVQGVKSEADVRCGIPNQIQEVSDFTATICVTNFSTSTVKLQKRKMLAVATTDIQVHDTVPSNTVRPTTNVSGLSDDIRLQQQYLQYITQQLHMKKGHFKELFNNRTDFRKDLWSAIQKAWINPPWKYVPEMVYKLLEETPMEWVCIVPKPRTVEKWFSTLQQLVGVTYLELPRTLATGYFTRHENDLPVQDLPFPEWDTCVFHGYRASVQLLDPVVRKTLLQELTPAVCAMLPTWCESIRCGEITEQQKEQLQQLLMEYGDVLDGSSLGKTSEVKCCIDTENNPPIQSKPYAYAPKERQIIRDEVQKMLDMDLIEPTRSAWTSPVVLVRKKDGPIRFCIDFRKLNSVTVNDVFPLPTITDTLDALGNSGIFSTMDLKSGYYQVPVADEYQDKTSFITHEGVYKFKRAPFGLKNMPSIFQRMMNKVLQGLTWQFFFSISG